MDIEKESGGPNSDEWYWTPGYKIGFKGVSLEEMIWIWSSYLVSRLEGHSSSLYSCNDELRSINGPTKLWWNWSKSLRLAKMVVDWFILKVVSCYQSMPMFWM